MLAPLWPANLDPSVAITSTVVIVFAVAVGVWVYVRYGLPISNDYHRAFGEPGIDPASIVMGLRLIAPLFAIGGVVAVLLPNPASAVVAIGAAMAYRLILSVVLLLKVARA